MQKTDFFGKKTQKEKNNTFLKNQEKYTKKPTIRPKGIVLGMSKGVYTELVEVENPWKTVEKQ